jgi:hypothetical protein
MTTAPAETALAVLEFAQQGRFADISDRFAPQLRPMVPPEALRAAWEAELAKNGPLASVGRPVTEPAGPGGVVVKVRLAFERNTLTMAVGMAGDHGWITGIQFLPASAAEPAAPWRPPPYADPGRFSETGVTVGGGPLAVPGTLSVPHQPGPVPGVVLLSGSGPHDQDETIGRNKPLKDLAWGLASAGIAVVRFEKVTHAHPDLVAADPAFTVTGEYVPHAVAAVGLLRDHPAVDAARVFVAGHSLGGSVAPRVARAEPRVAGLVIIAGGTEPLHRAAVRQFR